jgi:hypothetical protein
MFIIVKDVNILEESELYAFQPRPLDSVGLIATTGAETAIIMSR